MRETFSTTEKRRPFGSGLEDELESSEDKGISGFLKETFGGNGGGNFWRMFRTKGPKYFLLGLLLLLGWTSFYYNSNDENAVIQRFGKFVRQTGPGPHGKLPWPIETCTQVSVTTIRRLEVGYVTKEPASGNNSAVYTHNQTEAEMLTGDLNIIEVEWIVQYRISDPAKWLFSVRDPDLALRYLAESAMRQVNGGGTFDEVATTGRALIQDENTKVLQELSNKIDLGVTITQTQLQDVTPPDPVKDAFRDVTNAKEQQQKRIQDAEGYYNQKIPQARGEVESIKQAAIAYKNTRIDWARGDSARFLDVLAKYRQAPETTMQRLRLETIEKVLKDKPQLIDRSTQSPLKLFNTQQEAK